jgi:hypothetical protein
LKKNIYISIILFGLILQTCIQPYTPDLEPAPRRLVVEGLITDQIKKHRVKLSFLRNIKSFNSEALTNAVVEVIDQNGIIHEFTEKNQGEYYSDSTTFKAKIGSVYT